MIEGPPDFLKRLEGRAACPIRKEVDRRSRWPALSATSSASEPARALERVKGSALPTSATCGSMPACGGLRVEAARAGAHGGAAHHAAPSPVEPVSSAVPGLASDNSPSATHCEKDGAVTSRRDRGGAGPETGLTISRITACR